MYHGNYDYIFHACENIYSYVILIIFFKLDWMLHLFMPGVRYTETMVLSYTRFMNLSWIISSPDFITAIYYEMGGYS